MGNFFSPFRSHSELIVRTLFEPLAFILGIVISCLLLFSSVGVGYFKIFDIVGATNGKLAVSAALGIVIPISFITIFSIALSFLKHQGTTLPKGYNAASMLAGALLLAFLLISLVINILYYHDHFHQLEKLSDDKALEISRSFYFNLAIAFLAVSYSAFNDNFREMIAARVVEDDLLRKLQEQSIDESDVA